MECTKCKKTISSTAIFCPHCGSKNDRHEKKIVHDQNQKRAIPIGLIVVLFVLLVGAIVGVGWLRYHKDQKMKADQSAQQARDQTEIDQAATLANQLAGIKNQVFSLPSSTTKTKADWDSYFQDLIKQVNEISSKATGSSYSSSQADEISASTEKAGTDLSSYLTLDESLEDMGFQVKTDQNTVNSDQSLLTIFEASPYVSATSYQKDLTQAKSQLSTDQQAQTSQQQQLDALGTKVASDFVDLSFAKVYWNK